VCWPGPRASAELFRLSSMPGTLEGGGRRPEARECVAAAERHGEGLDRRDFCGGNALPVFLKSPPQGFAPSAQAVMAPRRTRPRSSSIQVQCRSLARRESD